MNIKNTIIAVLVVIILIGAYLLIKSKQESVSDNSWPQTEPVTPTDIQTNNTNSNTVARKSLLEIPLTEEAVSKAISSWNKTEMDERGGRFYVPKEWTVTKIQEDNQVMWRIDSPYTDSSKNYATVGNRMFSIQKYGEPTSCHGGDIENALCVYGSDPEINHYAKIVTYF